MAETLEITTLRPAPGLSADGRTGKTFKLATRTLAPDEQIEVTREHSFRPITTRRYYPGRHAISLQINGVESDRTEFALAPTDTP